MRRWFIVEIAFSIFLLLFFLSILAPHLIIIFDNIEKQFDNQVIFIFTLMFFIIMSFILVKISLQNDKNEW